MNVPDLPPGLSARAKHVSGRLTRYAGKRGDKPAVVVDIETHGLGGDFAGGAWLAQDESDPHFFVDIGEWVRAIFSERYRGYVWYAHNGGEYDFKYLIPYFHQLHQTLPGLVIRPVIQGRRRVIGFRIKYREHVIELRDSYALMPSSLVKLTAALAPEWHKLTFDHKTEVFDLSNAQHRAYLEYDVRGLLASLLMFRRLVHQTFGVSCGWTAASTALLAWRHTIPSGKSYWRQPERVRKFVRDAYFGGAVGLRDTHSHEDVLSLDTNAMHPFSMLRGVPNGVAAYTRFFEPGYVAIYRIRVTVPDETRYPTVPLRERNHQVVWPTGTFETVLCSHELDDITRYGCSWEVLEGYTFDHIAYPFSDFVQGCEKLELEHGRGSAIAEVIKIMRNALYGKFGTLEETTDYILATEPPPDSLYTPVIDEHSGKEVEGLWSCARVSHASFLHPEWAAWITAQSRITNHQTAALVGMQYWYYADTDSNKLDGEATRLAIADGRLVLGTRYGALKIDAEYSWFRAGGPKFYLGVLVDGTQELKVKGIPRDMVNFAAAEVTINGVAQHVEGVGLHGTLQMLKHGTSRASLQKRSYPQLINSQGWRVDQNGEVYPVRRVPNVGVAKTVEEVVPESG